ncbi:MULTISPECIES: glycosyltransferase family 1 protein [unclassified Mesorhizobium]|uniref:glycosyltransferase family 4 protein n=1 Tax=unclassified Mesorhizobium TaxID=325217 RepID=UPI000F74FADC|nr:MULTISPECIES: glycosyltransferase family 1 protein [unclassified Mesorhizobium]AZO09413.1 glycosyltransferase family 1 protein [Mesorhizobium sp. M3A.F.Ca.ET.080.04.2.1]RWB67987.1 MAG: glycosyltransferase family 1 protein [Mesorhizobium sp.]RWB87744.1 MAG: glycosyltransferase family 1 protein [Mesorhizobium sp.]RWE36235.1 MAG: glycosyltransferase family 1 protein [Mesorhizobium sp.]RWF26295.1 MAG: glycosyltransferase family 1 protein [Mesorhizobium sp.]
MAKLEYDATELPSNPKQWNGHRAGIPLTRSLAENAENLIGHPGWRWAEQKTSRRRWTVNGDFTTLRPNGVARYAREVTMALDALISERHPLARDLEIDLVAPRPLSEPLQLDAIPVRVVPEFSKPRLPQFWVQAQLPRHVPGGLLSFCNLAPVLVRRQIACIHDMHTRLMPASYGRGFRWAHRLILPALGRRAARITTVSQLSRSHLVGFGIAPDENIVVTYNGSDHAKRWDAARSSLSVDRGRPYVLCLGRRDQEYKNMGLLARVAQLLDDMGLDLWMPGDVDETTILRYVPKLPTNIVLLGRIGDDDFKKALEGALCFLFPSRIEGFGLPAVEAMASGCPVIASTSPCLPEVCGDSALYADPEDVHSWAEKIRQLMNNSSLREWLIAKGHARASSYSWRWIAWKYLELMVQVDADFEEVAG